MENKMGQIRTRKGISQSQLASLLKNFQIERLQDY